MSVHTNGRQALKLYLHNKVEKVAQYFPGANKIVELLMEFAIKQLTPLRI